MPSLDYSIALIPIAPFLAAFLAPSIHRFLGHLSGWLLAIVPASIFVFLLTLLPLIGDGQRLRFAVEWVPVYDLTFSFLLDGLSMTFALLISGIGTIIVIYSGAYMRGHVHQGRFFAFILMFMGSMLGLVLADHMIVLFVFWELTAITSFLLIGFDHSRQASRRAAIQAIVITGIGGLALLVGILLLNYLSGAWNLSDMGEVAVYLRSSEVLEGGQYVNFYQSGFYFWLVALFCFAAFTKSAQFPFHFWLPNAMEAPTPVSAFLHSATMVKGGVYLLARMSPALGGTNLWGITLVVVGGVTLVYGATLALRQTDMKQMLAQTTVASLGLLVLLIGAGGEMAISAMVIYLVAHALYKAGLFLAVGTIDHETGTREITELGGMRKLMPITFIATALAAISMAGLPPAIGFFAKEEMYLALAEGSLPATLVLVALIAGNAMMLVVGAAIAIKPFLGGIKPTPLAPHEGSLGLWVGPLLFGLLALAAGFLLKEFGHYFLEPTASAVYNIAVESHLKLTLETFTNPIILLSVLTWALGGLLFWKLDLVRTWLDRLEARIGWNFDIGFDAVMFGLIRFSDGITRLWHHGRLEYYLIVVFVAFAFALYLPLFAGGHVFTLPPIPMMSFYEWGVMLIAVAGLAAVLLARTRLVAIVSLGIQGFAVALIFMLFGAPDLSFTQFMVETLSVVILTLVMTRLHLEQRDNRVLSEMLRDGGLALICGAGVTILLFAVLQTDLDMRLTEFFAATSVPIAHGHNIVNVILVDYRGLDTLGEISVVMTAGIAILALIRMRGGGPQLGIGAAKKATRRSKSKAAATTKTATRAKVSAKSKTVQP